MADEFDALEEEFAQVANQPFEAQDLRSEEAEEVAEEVTEETVEETVEPEVSTEPVTEEAQPEGVVDEKPVEAKTYPVPNDPKFGESAGKKLTAAELDELGLLEKFTTWEHQELHHTKLYQELKPELDQLRAQVQAQQAQVQQETAFSPEAIAKNASDTQHAYLPHLSNLAKAGAFEEDFLVAYPKVASQMEQRFDAGTGALMLLNQRIAAIEQSVGRREQEVQRHESENRVMTSIDQVVSEDEGAYGVLADKDSRSGFIGWLVDPQNPLPFKDMPVSSVSPEIIKAAFLAYVQANPSVIQSREQPENVPVSQGSGTTGTRQRSVKDQFEQLEDEFNTLALNRFGG